MVDLILIFFVAFILLVGIKNGIGRYDPTDRTKSNAFRGVFAIVIILFHLSQQTSGGIIFRFMREVGYLAVAFFFFISGYALRTQLENAGGGILMDS